MNFDIMMLSSDIRLSVAWLPIINESRLPVAIFGDDSCLDRVEEAFDVDDVDDR